jgi:uncharacterized protein (TIGR00730 family)
MRKRICVFCSSSNAVDPAFLAAAADMGRSIAQRGYALVYGGGALGLMGAMARAVHAHGGIVIGYIPEFMHAWPGVAYTQADELVLTRDMRERQALMEERADAFVVLPGGFGTLEELFEMLTFKQLERHTKPIVIVNTCGFYDHLLRLLEHIVAARFARPDHLGLCHAVDDPDAALDYIEQYKPAPVSSKWR